MYPLLLALLSAILFGASTPVGKVLLERVSPFQLAGLLYLGAAVGVLPGMRVQRAGLTALRKMGRRNGLRLAGAIGLGGLVAPVLLLMGLQRASAASVAMWLNLELAATAILGFILFRDHLGVGGWLGAAGTILASTLLSREGGAVGPVALILVSGACICWGLDNHLTALIDGISPQLSTFCKGLAAGGVNLVIGIALEGPAPGFATVAAAMTVGAFSYGASITLYIKSAQQLGATRSQMVFSSAPFFGVALAVIFLGEPLTRVQIVAAGLLTISLAILFRDQHAHPHTHEPLDHQHEHDHADPHHQGHHAASANYERHHHPHRHEPQAHSHPHWPDIHHRHGHSDEDE